MLLETESLCTGLRVPGGKDREGRPIGIFTIPQDRTKFRETIQYFTSIYSEETKRAGLRLILEGGVRRTGLGKVLHAFLAEENIACLILRPEAFWGKSVDNCAKPSAEPICISPSRLQKYIDLSNLPEDLGGTLKHDRDIWLHQRIKADLFFHESEEVSSELERVTRLLVGAKGGSNNAARTMTQTRATYCNTNQAATELTLQGESLIDEISTNPTDALGQDVLDTRKRIEQELAALRTKLLALQSAWTALNKFISHVKEVEKLEIGVKNVTQWLLTKGEELLARHCSIGYDITSAEYLRREHEYLEFACRETYGRYAELLHKLDSNGLDIPSDLRAQRDFMDFLVRVFASRIERRRNILISSSRFFRLVSEFFKTTSEIYESLVMAPDLGALENAQSTLLQLQDSQTTIDELEEWVMREGEKLSDLLSMPVKDSFGREMIINYEPDINNVSEILEMSRARWELFRDNVELQRITLEQASHIFTYESDAAQAGRWLEELFQVMLKSHADVGCNLPEIQKQKEMQLNFEETAKCAFGYGEQLLRGALLLRRLCKLDEGNNRRLTERLTEGWFNFTNVGQAHLTRLRVTAVFHRDMEKHGSDLKHLIEAAVHAKSEDLKDLLTNRELILLEVARMIRLARLLKSRLREPLSSQHEVTLDYNRSAVEAISERVAEITALAEQLDSALQNRHKYPHNSDFSQFNTTEDWFETLDKSVTDSSSSKTYEEEFQTASECTCTPPSRSSSFHTASEGYLSPWWSDTDRSPPTSSDGAEVGEASQVSLAQQSEVKWREEPVEGASEGSSTYLSGFAKRAVVSLL